MKKLFLIFIIALTSLSVKSQNEKLNEIINKLQTYYQYNPSEKVYLSTNKEVFKPGETIWFNAFINCYTNPQEKDITDVLEVKLYNSNGTMMMLDKYHIANSQSEGDFLLPDVLNHGMYFLVAHTLLAKDENDVYLKMIFVDTKDEEQIQVDPVQIPTLLTSGKANILHYSLHKISGSSYKSGKLKYELYEADNLILDGKIKTEKDGSLKLKLDLPDKKYESPLKLLMFDNGNHLNYTKIFPVDSEKLQLKFSAEGGDYIAGKPIKLVFKVTNGAGQPVEIQGDLFDESGKKISQITTMSPGYGMFPFVGEESKQYKLLVTSDFGNGQVFELPKFKNEGLCLSIENMEDKFVHLRLMFADNKEHPAYLLITKGGMVSWATEINVNGGIRIKLPKENFPAGLSLISVFDKDGKLLAERTIYVDKNHKLNVHVKTADRKVVVGETINLNINVIPEDSTDVSGNATISVSAFNETIQGVNELESCFIFNNELENPIPVMKRNGKGKNSDNILNYLLISSGLKNFSWKEVLEFDVERMDELENGIGGYVMDEKKQPVENAKVSLVNIRNTQILTNASDENGNFFFSGINPDDKENFVIRAVGKDGSKDLTVKFEKSFETKLSERVSKMSAMYSLNEKPMISNDYFVQNRQLFKPFEKTKLAQKKGPHYKAFLNDATGLLDVIKMIKPFNLYGDKIVFGGSRNSILAQDGALIVIDGQKLGTSSSALNAIAPSDIESINISTNVIDIQEYTGFNSVGIIEITTKKGEKTSNDDIVELSNYKDGFRVIKDFMEQQADFQDNNNTTLYWNPSMEFDSSSSLNIEIPTSNVSGKFLIEVEAIDNKGRIGTARKIIDIVKN